ncbi:MAG: alanine racemase, partial [Rectinemataceae bacterium]
MVSQEYSFPLENYMSREKFERIREFARDKETPCLILDLEVIRRNYENLRTYLPYATVYYAVKANPDDAVISLLRDLGSCFDVASVYELDQLLRLGVTPDRMSYGNTIKKEKDIAYFYEKGIRLFVTDSMQDLDKISRAAPGSKVFFRLLTEGLGADWPLSKKFGSHPDMARQLIKTAVRFGLEPYGISFHPGSQQRDVGQWSSALTQVAQLFNWARNELKVDLRMINMGGGFPANYIEPTESIQQYAEDIKRFLDNSFGQEWPEKII